MLGFTKCQIMVTIFTMWFGLLFVLMFIAMENLADYDNKDIYACNLK